MACGGGENRRWPVDCYCRRRVAFWLAFRGRDGVDEKMGGWGGREERGEEKRSPVGVDRPGGTVQRRLSKAKPKPRRVNEIQGAGWDEMEWTRSRKVKVKPQKDKTPLSL